MNKKPRLIIVTGRPGSGKTTLSKELGLMINFPVFCRDELKEGYVNTFGIRDTELPKNTNKIIADAFFDIIELALSKKISIIIEAAYPHDVWEWYIKKIEDMCEISVIVCKIDKKLAAKRHLERGLQDPGREYYHGDLSVTHYKKTGEMLPPNEHNTANLPYPTYIVATKNKYSPSLNTIRKKIIK